MAMAARGALLLALVRPSAAYVQPRAVRLGTSSIKASHYPSFQHPKAAHRAIITASDADDGSGSATLGVLGGLGIAASLVCFLSEFALKTTGCGLPAGPFGLYGATEGISYIGIVVIVGASLVKKVRTGSGLPAGPYGLLGAAEGLAFLAALVGIVVAGITIFETGGLPNAIPEEGGKCS